MNQVYIICVLLVLSSAHVICQTASNDDDLTAQLAGDSDSVASILGVGEAVNLVDSALKRVKEKRNKAILKSHLAEVKALAAAKRDQTFVQRHFETKLKLYLS